MILLSYDEAASLHENLHLIGDSIVANEGFFYNTTSWVVPTSVIVAAVGLAFLPFFRTLPKKVGALMLVSGACYLIGAFGIEMVAAKYVNSVMPSGNRNFPSDLLVAAEEAMEMGGLSLFSYAVLTWLSEGSRSIRLQFQ